MFGYRNIDDHPQSVTYRLQKEFRAMADSMGKTQDLVLDKYSREDLTDEEYRELQQVNYKLVDLTNLIFNCTGRMDTKYGLNLSSYMQEENPPAMSSRRVL